MSLSEISSKYAEDAAAIHARIEELRAAEKVEADPNVARQLRLRIEALRPLLREAKELAMLTDRYYDRSYHKHEKYTL